MAIRWAAAGLMLCLGHVATAQDVPRSGPDPAAVALADALGRAHGAHRFLLWRCLITGPMSREPPGITLGLADLRRRVTEEARWVELRHAQLARARPAEALRPFAAADAVEMTLLQAPDRLAACGDAGGIAEAALAIVQRHDGPSR